MKVTLEFNLPEDQEDYHNSVQGPSLAAAAFNFQQWLRQRRKYEDKSIEEEQAFFEFFEGLLED